MNRWECDHPGCKVEAVGVGPAYGLRAIGWYFEIGKGLFCPSHRPDRVPCLDNENNAGVQCSLCAADVTMAVLQKRIAPEVEDRVLRPVHQILRDTQREMRKALDD